MATTRETNKTVPMFFPNGSEPGIGLTMTNWAKATTIRANLHCETRPSMMRKQDARARRPHRAQGYHNQQGFKAIAGAAFISEHSFSTKETPIVAGRPDAVDLEKAKKFGEQTKAKLDCLTKLPELNIPGNRPYRERNPAGPRSPETTFETCTLCGLR